MDRDHGSKTTYAVVLLPQPELIAGGEGAAGYSSNVVATTMLDFHFDYS